MSLDMKKDPLVEVDAVVPWEEFRPLLERVWRKPDSERKSRAGRKPMDAVLMFKALVLGALYNLSDDQVEYQIRDRLSFMRFLGLGLGDGVPDAKTVWLYREALAQAGKVDDRFKLFDRHLARHGYIARGGQILDAPIVPVPRNHNTREENAAIKGCEEPEGRENKPAKRCQKDVDARWTKKHGKSHFGYKNHVNVDRSQADPTLSCLRCRPSRACKGMHCQAVVEHVFGAQSNDMGGTMVKTIGLVRAKAKIGMKTLVYNIRRLGQWRRINPFPA